MAKYYFYLLKDAKAKEKAKHHENESHEEHEKEEHKPYGRYTRDFDALNEMIHNPPHTWDAYPRNGDGFMDIITMEFNELRKADKEGNYRGTVENYLHIAAACMAAHHRMTCDK